MPSRSLPSASNARLGQLAQPGADDRAAHPEAGDLLELDRELRLVHQLEALGVGLHDPVLDAVVDHLHEVAGARVAEVAPAVRRGEHVEDRREPLHRVLVAADHHAVADLEPPDAAGRADVDVVDALDRRASAARRTSSCQFVLPPSTIVSPALEQRRRATSIGLLGRVARRDHEPDHARRLELVDEVLERVRAGRAVALGGADGVRRCSRTRRPGGPSRGGCDGPCCRPSCRGRRSRVASRGPLGVG